MTEEEAKAKWCPFARAIPAQTTANTATFTSGLTAFNRYQVPAGAPEMIPGGARCIGSACMAWQVTAKGIPHRPDHPARGFCGLAESKEGANI